MNLNSQVGGRSNTISLCKNAHPCSAFDACRVLLSFAWTLLSQLILLQMYEEMHTWRIDLYSLLKGVVALTFQL